MSRSFHRDRFFWTLTLQTVVVNFFLGGFGPAQPILRADQHTSLAIAGLHGTALGIAAILAGLFNPRLAHYFGRTRLSWIGISFFLTGLVLFVLLQPVQMTLLAALIAGFGTSIVINNMLTSFNSHYGAKAHFAVPQANAIASIGFVAGTLLVGALAGSARTHWRFALLLAIPVAAIAYFVVREKDLDEHVPDVQGPQAGKLSRKFWISWFGFVACISSEFAILFWAAALLHDRTGSSAAIATVSIVALGTGVGLGRWFGGGVLRKFELDHQLLIVIGLQFIGFAAFWFSHTLLISIASLFIAGLGISLQFALASIRLMGLSGGRPDLAVGRGSLAAGIAIGGAPLILGLLGDNFGISRGYLMVPVLIVIAFIIVLVIPSHVEEKQIA